jgi:hypothetical protein
MLVKHFFLGLPQGVKVSAHPYDGFADPQWPFRYRNRTRLDAVISFCIEMNELLTQLHSKVLFSGLVFGESMGGMPYQNNQQTVQLFRN